MLQRIVMFVVGIIFMYLFGLGTAQTGRTVGRFVRFLVDDSAGTIREIPIDSINGVGLDHPFADVSALQDAVKSGLTETPDCTIDITGPFDNTAAAAAGGSGAAPSLSSSHTVLSAINGVLVPLTLDVRFGMQHYWETGEPQFGITSSAANGFICTKYIVDPGTMKYSASFKVFAGSVAPAWGTAAET